MKEKLKTVNIKGKEYVTVSERIRYFNEAYKNGMIKTEILSQENNQILIKATVIPNIEKPERLFTGLAQEQQGKGMVNTTSYIENCETSAVGRALGFMGIGAETSIASAEEVASAIAKQNRQEIKEPQIKEPQPKEPEVVNEPPQQGYIPQNKPEQPQKAKEEQKATPTTPKKKSTPKKADMSNEDKQDSIYFVKQAISKPPDEVSDKELKESFKLMESVLGKPLFQECLSFWGKKSVAEIKKASMAKMILQIMINKAGNGE